MRMLAFSYLRQVLIKETGHRADAPTSLTDCQGAGLCGSAVPPTGQRHPEGQRTFAAGRKEAGAPCPRLAWAPSPAGMDKVRMVIAVAALYSKCNDSLSWAAR